MKEKDACEEDKERKKVVVRFKNVKDFHSRIAALWQDQKEDEIYDFIFDDKETEKAFEKLMACFTKNQ